MFSIDIRDFYHKRIELIKGNEKLVNFLLSTPIGKRQEGKENPFEKTFNAYLEEAVVTVSLFRDLNINKSTTLLEVGGGVGLTYIYLKSLGVNIVSIEPSDSGFDDYFSIGRVFCSICEISDEDWHPLLGEEVTQLNTSFDVIFSNNVLEHVPTIDETFDALTLVLKPDGIMVHNTVNYIIPYEPHFGIFLFPGFPRLTQLFKPHLKNSDMWKGLNFITTSRMKGICKRLDLKADFDNQVMYRTFVRIKNDPHFAQRQKLFVPVIKIFDFLKLTELLKHIPARFNTPMKFSVKHKF